MGIFDKTHCYIKTRGNAPAFDDEIKYFREADGVVLYTKNPREEVRIYKGSIEAEKFYVHHRTVLFRIIFWAVVFIVVDAVLNAAYDDITKQPQSSVTPTTAATTETPATTATAVPRL